MNSYWDKASQEHPQTHKDGNVSPIDANGWRPMDSAPRDGSMMLVYNPMFGVYSTSYTTQWRDGDKDYRGFPCGFHEGMFGAWDCTPVAWQPLPKPPSNPFNALLPEPVE